MRRPLFTAVCPPLFALFVAVDTRSLSHSLTRSVSILVISPVSARLLSYLSPSHLCLFDYSFSLSPCVLSLPLSLCACLALCLPLSTKASTPRLCHINECGSDGGRPPSLAGGLQPFLVYVAMFSHDGCGCGPVINILQFL